MADAMQEKKYTIDFFQLDLQPTSSISSIQKGLQKLIDDDECTSLEVNGYTREIWKLGAQNGNKGYRGQFRKFRTSDLPEIGSAGEDASEIELEDDQGLVERNFFVFYPRNQILAWCRNAHGNTPNQLAKFLSTLWSTSILATPILEPDAVKRLMKREVDLKRVKIVIPRPTNPDMYDANEFTKGMMEMMNGVSADSIHIELGIDSRRADTAGKLTNTLKRALALAAQGNASSVRATVLDGGIEHPIDLIADRVFSVQKIETNAKYPPTGEMYKAIDTAMHECQGQINEYFGSLENAVV